MTIIGYDSLSQLPSGIKKSLPVRAQKIYLKVFNKTVRTNAASSQASTIAHKKAWSAVKAKFELSGLGSWNQKINKGET